MSASTDATRPAGPEAIRVAVAQSAPSTRTPDRNRARILEAVRRGLDDHADLLVLPELANSGYVSSREQAVMAGEAIPDGPLLGVLQDALAGTQMLVAIGLCERASHGVFDSAVLLDRTGVLLHYRKIHLWETERRVFDEGDLGLPVARTRIGVVGLLVCFDLWFPEAPRLLALGGAEIVCAPSNWDRVADRYYTEDLRVSIAATHAHLNEVVMACADRVGEDEGLDFVGRSVICDPRGIVAGPADAIREDWLLADVRLEKVRNRWSAPSGHLASRRKDVYSLVASPAPAAERESQ